MTMLDLPEQVKLSRMLDPGHSIEMCSTSPTVQLCRKTLLFVPEPVVPLPVADGSNCKFASNWGSVVDDFVPFLDVEIT